MPWTPELTLPVVDLARKNEEFRKVLWTGVKTRLVSMAIPEGGEIGETECGISYGNVSIVPSGTFRNTGSGMLKLFTTYRSPEHDRSTEHATKSEADAEE